MPGAEATLPIRLKNKGMFSFDNAEFIIFISGCSDCLFVRLLLLRGKLGAAHAAEKLSELAPARVRDRVPFRIRQDTASDPFKKRHVFDSPHLFCL